MATDPLIYASLLFGGVGMLAAIFTVRFYIKSDAQVREQKEAFQQKALDTKIQSATNQVIEKVDSKLNVVSEQIKGVCTVVSGAQQTFDERMKSKDEAINHIETNINTIENDLKQVRDMTVKHETNLGIVMPALDDIKEKVAGLKAITDLSSVPK